MPTYDYRCLQCDHRFEAFQKMSDLSLTQCPLCAGTVERLMGAGLGLIFKGSGFYITDYKKSNSSTSSASTGDKSREGNQENSTGEKKPREGKQENSAGEKKSTESKPAENTSTESKKSETKSENKTETKTDKAAA